MRQCKEQTGNQGGASAPDQSCQRANILVWQRASYSTQDSCLTARCSWVWDSSSGCKVSLGSACRLGQAPGAGQSAGRMHGCLPPDQAKPWCRKVPSRPRIELSAKTGLPKGVLARAKAGPAAAESLQEPTRQPIVGQEAVQPRRRDESTEERRQRKSAVKHAKVRCARPAECDCRLFSLAGGAAADASDIGILGIEW